MIISLDGLEFHGHAHRSLYTVEGGALDGWFDAPAPRSDTVDRPMAHGTFAGLTFKAGRSVAWHGLVLTGSPGEQRAAMEHLAGMAQDPGLHTLTVQHDSVVTYARVNLVRPATTKVESYGRVARYEVEAFAPDPHRYGELRTFTGSSVVPFHRGNTDAVPTITVTGSFPDGYSIGFKSRDFIVRSALANGQSDVIDMKTGWVKRNGVVQPGAATRAELITIPRGVQSSAIQLTANGSGSGSMTVDLRDTYF